MHCAIQTARRILHTAHCILHTTHYTSNMAYCKVHTKNGAHQTAYYNLHKPIAAYTIHAIQHNIRNALIIMHNAPCMLHASTVTPRTTYYELQAAQNTLHTAHDTLNTAHCTLHTTDYILPAAAA